MATDYDAPRTPRGTVEETDENTLQQLSIRRTDAQSGSVDVDDTELAESELPGADLSSLSEEELSVHVIPKQDDEFTCARCFLVQHRSRIGRERANELLCRDCA